MRRLSTLVPVIVDALSACASRDRGPEGTYALRTVGADSLPLVRPGHVPGERTELKGATLVLLPGGRLIARADLSVTDSGTVDVAEHAAGTWERHGDSLFLAYH